MFLRANSLKIVYIIVSDDDDSNESDDGYNKAGTRAIIKGGFWGLYGARPLAPTRSFTSWVLFCKIAYPLNLLVPFTKRFLHAWHGTQLFSL